MADELLNEEQRAQLMARLGGSQEGTPAPAAQEGAQPPIDPNAPAQTEPGMAPQAPEGGPRLYADKYKTVEDMETGYKELNGEYTRLKQSAADNKRTIQETVSAEIQKIADMMQAQKAQEAVKEPVDVLDDADMQALWEENPLKAVAELIKRSNEPIVQKQNEQDRLAALSKAYDEASKRYADFGSYVPEINEILKMLDTDLKRHPLIFDIAYSMAKAKNFKSVDDLMKDDSAIQSMADNPKIQEIVIAKHLDNIKKGGKDAPPLIGSGAGGETVTIPPEEPPKTFTEATAKVAKRFGIKW